VFLVGGIASVTFGVLALLNPAAALFVLGMFLAAFLLVDGAVSAWGGLRHRDKEGGWLILVLGLLSMGVGGYALFAAPGLAMIAVVYLVAFVAMLFGVSALYLGWKLRAEIRGEWLLYLSGALSVLFSALILFRPLEGVLSVVFVIAWWAIMVGLLRILFALRVRALGRDGDG
jgi:uncharacterized membrane protein HdeD (DUF308 family)